MFFQPTLLVDNCVVVVGECCGGSIMVARALASISFIKDHSRQEWWLEPLTCTLLAGGHGRQQGLGPAMDSLAAVGALAVGVFSCACMISPLTFALH